MPFLKRISSRRLSIGRWSKKSKKATREEDNEKKGVRFDPCQVQFIDSKYAITDEVQKALWYRKKDLIMMKAKNEELTAKAVQANSSAVKRRMSDNKECYRGLELRIRDQTSRLEGLPTIADLYREFSQGLIDLQFNQLCEQGAYDEEAIRDYCLKHSQRRQSVAELIAARDALCAFRIYEASDHCMMPFLQKGCTQDQESPKEYQTESIRKICRRTSWPTESQPSVPSRAQ